MPRQNLRSVIQAESIAPTALGTYLADGTLFRRFPSNVSNPVQPTRQKTVDNMVGSGNPFERKGKPYRFDPRNIQVQGALTDTIAVRLIRDALGGSVSDTVNTTPNLTTDSLIHMKAAGAVPLLRNYLRDKDGIALLHGDVFTQSFTLDQQGDAEPTIDGALSNSGHYQKLSTSGITTTDVTAQTPYKKMHGIKTSLTFSDGTTTYDFATAGRLLNVNFQYNQNVIVEGLMGDPFIDTTNECLGAYAKNVYIDVQNAILKAKVYMDGSYTEFDAWVADKTITSVSLLFRTCEKIVGTHLFEIEIKIPIAEFNLTPDVQGNFSAFGFEIKAVEGDPTTGDLVQARIRHLTSAGIETIL